jgi:hypothetical protein
MSRADAPPVSAPAGPPGGAEALGASIAALPARLDRVVASWAAA